MWRNWLIQFGIWLARHGGWNEGPITAPYEAQIHRLSIEAERLSVEAMHRGEVIQDVTLKKEALAQVVAERERALHQSSAESIRREQIISGVITGLRNEISDLQARMATAATVAKPVFTRAAILTRDADTTLSGGEAKRHQVYARLIKDFPAVNKRELALAIELALFHASKEG